MEDNLSSVRLGIVKANAPASKNARTDSRVSKCTAEKKGMIPLMIPLSQID
jgi:hypothetical protein